MHRFVLCLAFLLLASTLVLPEKARAQLIPSFTLKASVTKRHIVWLDWTRPPDTLTHSYTVWRGVLTDPATVDTSVTFVNVATTSDTSYVDTTQVSGLTYFLYVVKTQNGNSQTTRSSYAVVVVRPPIDGVQFTSEPPVRARVGVLYTYQVTAVSSDSAAVLRYRLLLKPGNMTIDSVSGLVQWTPAVPGYRDVSIGVFSSKGGSDLQNYSVSVGLGNGIVTGTVHDSATGLPVRHVFIRMYEANVNFHLGYYTTTDSTGSFTIHNVDSGKYFIHAYPFNPHYLPQWWAYARFRFGATPISVVDSPAVTNVVFSLLTDSLRLPIHRAQGFVTDTLGNPIRGALVVWARAEFGLNGSLFDPDDSTHDEDSRDAFDINNNLPSSDLSLDDASRWVYRAFTDSLGKFSLRIPEGFYIVRASKRGYYNLFFNNEQNILMADIIALRSDTANINFSLHPFPPGPLGEISGMISDSVSGRGVPSRVIAYRQWWVSHDPIPYYRHYVTDTDSLGNYDLTELPPGLYRILAMPLGQYIPCWYSIGGGEIVRWRQATPINIDGNDVADVNITVLPIPRSASGYTSIGGVVTSSSGPSAPAGLDLVRLVHGAVVYAVDQTGLVAGYGLTDGAGAYTIAGLAPGMYTLVMDGSEYQSQIVTGVSPTYDVNGNAVPASQDIATASDLTGVEEPVAPGRPVAFSLDQNYPNPFNPSTQIGFSLPVASRVRLVLYNVLGQEVATLVNDERPAGSYTVRFDASRLATGVYFYRLEAGSFAQTRKLLLLK